MTKTGIFKNKNTNEQYIVVVNVTQNKGERIELYRTAEDYSPVDTTNAISAYFRKSREYVYGDKDLITEYLSAYNSCITLNGKIEQSTAMTPKGFVIIQSKSNDSLGVSSKVTMLNGHIVEEEYITNDYVISIESIDAESSSTLFVEPLNIRDYKLISILSDFDDDDNIDADYYSLDYLKSKYPLEHLDNYDYVVALDMEVARERLNKWKNAPVKLKSVDIETTGLDVSIYGNDVITGIVLSYDWEPLGEIENSTYFPFRQKNFPNNLPIEFLSEIAEAVNSQPKCNDADFTSNEGVLILAHNGKMERKGFWQDNLDIRIDVDTYTLSTLIDTRMERGLHTLKNRAYQATGLFWLELEHIFKTKEIRFDILPVDIVKAYACADTPNTIKVYKHLMKKLPPTEYAVFDIENKLQRCKSINEYYGLRLDQDGLIKRLKNVEYCFDKLSTMFKQIHKTSKNINSADVLRDIVYNKLGCKVVVRTKKNKPSTSVDAIDNIVSHGTLKNVDLNNNVPDNVYDLYGDVIIKGKDLKCNRYPSLVILACYNKFKKELGALRRLQKKSNLNRVMFGINGKGAASGRQTSDAHQYSDTMKALVVSDTPEHDLISVDYSQVELRVLAYLIQDPRLIEQMKDKHIDIHRAFLSSIYNIPVHMISAVMRSAGKQVNFGVVYGISEYGLARNKYGPEYTKEQLLECSKAITDFYNGIPGVKKLAEDNRKFVFEHGYIETKFGYRRIFPQVFDPDLDNKAKARIFRAANNTPVQGFAAHLMKQAEINYDNYIRAKGWDKTIEYMGGQFPLVRVMLSIHDEVLISAHKSIDREEIVKMCKECMEIEIPNAPPFFAVPAFVDNWYQGKSDEYEMSISMRDDILEAWEDGHRRIVDWNNLTKSIKDYKHKQIKDYMTGLIKEYKTVEEVTKHIDHPEYTHLLIAIYVTKDFVKNHSHEECIELAVKSYMENSSKTVEQEHDSYEEYNEDVKVQDAVSYLKELEEYVEIDETGQVVEHDQIDSEFTEEDDDSYKYYYDESNDPRFSKTSVGVVFMGDIAIIDTTDIKTLEDLKSFNSDIISMSNPNGYYQVTYMRGSAMMPTKLKIDAIQSDILQALEKYTRKGDVSYVS